MNRTKNNNGYFDETWKPQSPSRLTIPFIALMWVALVSTVLLMALDNIKREAENDVRNSISTVLESTHGLIIGWVKENRRDLENLVNQKDFKTAAAILSEEVSAGYNNDNSETFSKLNEIINSHFGDKNGWKFTLVPKSSRTLISFSSNGNMRTYGAGKDDKFINKMLSGEFATDTRRDWFFEQDNPESITSSAGFVMFGVPVKDPFGRVIAGFALGVKLDREFTQLTMLGRIGKTGETYAFNRNAVMLSESRFQDRLSQANLVKPGEISSFAISIKDPGGDMTSGYRPHVSRDELPLTKMARDATNGFDGEDMQGYRDYRGVMVVGEWLWDEQLGIGLATEMDLTEAYSAYNLTRTIIFLVMGVTGALTLVLYLMLLGGSRQSATLARTAMFANELLRKEIQVREKTEEALKNSEKRLQGMMDNTTSVIYMKDPQGKYIHANKRFLRLFHLNAENVIGKTDFDIFPKKTAAAFRSNDLTVLNTGELLEIEEIAPTSNGERTYIAVKFPLYDENGKTQGLCGVSTDITERKRAEMALKESERRFRHMLEDVNLLSVMLDNKGNVTFINAYLLELTGYKWEEVVGRNWFEMFIPEEISQQVKETFSKLVSGEGDFLKSYENEILTSDGQRKLVAWNNTELFDADGHVSGTASMGVDITEQRAAVEALARSESRLDDIARNSGDWIWELDQNGNISYSSPVVEAITGSKPEDVTGAHFSVLLLPEEVESVVGQAKDLFTRRESFVNIASRIIHKNGSVVYLESSGMPIISANGKCMGYRGSSRDITARIISERALKESQQSLAHAQSIAHIGNWDWNILTNELQWTDEIYRIFGLEPQQFGATYEAFVDRIHPDDRDNVNEAVMWAVEDKKDYYVEHRVVRPDGETRIVTERGEVYRDEKGRPLRMVGVVQDVTDNRMAQRARLESEERLASFMNSATDIFTLYDENMDLIEINQAGLDMFGVTREQVIGKNMVDLQMDDEAEAQLNQFRQVIKTGEPLQQDQALEHPVHGVRYIQIKAFKVGSGMGLISSDITEAKLSAEKLYKNQQHLAKAQRVGKMGSWELSLDTMDVTWSEQVDDIFQFDTSTPASLDKLWNAIHPDDLETVRINLDAVVKEGATSINVEHRAILSDGKNIVVNSVGEVVYDADGKPDRLLGVVQDITAKKKADEQLLLAAKVFDSSLDGIMVVDNARKISSVNKAFFDITGFTEEEAIGADIGVIEAEYQSLDHGKCVKAALEEATEQGSFKGEIWLKRNSGKIFPAWMNINSIKGEYGVGMQFVITFHDITESKEKEKEIEYQAYYDTLTGLPNRLLFQDRLKMAVARAKRENEVLALMFLDLDNFKNVNDSLGHDVGDLLLKGVSVRLVEALREIDTVARIGGDEFVILLESLKDQNEAVRVARKVIKSLNQSFKFQNKPLYVTGSLGITLFPEDGMDTDTLLKNADMAMYKAKEMGKGGFQMFTSDMNEKFASRLAMENNLREAMDKDQFVVHYQPKMDISSGAITGMEALVRWIRPDGSITSPGDFIPVAEETGMILRIGETVLRKSLRHLARLNAKMGTKLKMSVNLSARQFAQENVVEMVTMILRDTGVEPSLLELEITESSVMVDVEKAMVKMKQLKKLGVKLSIDDFGTGFSSLNYLRKFPIDVLKIDQSFVMGMKKNNADTAIVDSIITIAKNLGLKVVAEGVETKNQLHMLRGLGCDEIQGYLISRPIAEDKIMDVIAELSRQRAIA